MNHSPEPWSLDGGDSIIFLGGDPEAYFDVLRSFSGLGTCSVADSIDYANAKRIVACVNACAGIEDPAATLAEVRRVLDGVLDSIVDLSNDSRAEMGDDNVRDIKAVLAKLEGKPEPETT